MRPLFKLMYQCSKNGIRESNSYSIQNTYRLIQIRKATLKMF